MEKKKLDEFKALLLQELRAHINNVREDQAAAIDNTDDGVKDSIDLSLLDVGKEIAFLLGEKESQMVADIDQALLRIEEGTYGICARCDRKIDERRLRAMPTARYDAVCQTEIEASQGLDEMPTL